MKEIFKKNLFFLIPYLIFLLSGTILLLAFSKPQLHIFMNRHYSDFFDTFFYYITYLGDGIFAVFVIALMLFSGFRNFLFMTLTCLLSLGIVTLCKQFFFDEAFRPHAYFSWVYPYKLRLVDGVDYHGFNSFPSGHTMSAFCVFFGLALIVKNKWMKLVFFIIALLTGYSRVYLSQHFFVDVVAGSAIAVSITLLIYYFAGRINNSRIDKSVFDLLFRKK